MLYLCPVENDNSIVSSDTPLTSDAYLLFYREHINKLKREYL